MSPAREFGFWFLAVTLLAGMVVAAMHYYYFRRNMLRKSAGPGRGPKGRGDR